MSRAAAPLAVLLALSAGAALAQPAPAPGALTTATLAELCGAAPDRSDAPATAFCRGFIVGAAQHHHATSSRRAYCLPDPGPSQAEFQRGFAAWARANPQFGGERAVEGLTRFAAATYPCPPRAAAARPR
ncbi:MAG: hypothetical protein MUF65_07200 [Rubritepida sp.]|nr:hypothetical protein [Rubritepida sp.]